MTPLARKNGICIEDLENEVVLYDTATHQAHCLNRTSFAVWENADGTRGLKELAKILHEQLGTPISSDLVLLAIQNLEKANLVQCTGDAPPKREFSRRDIGKKLALAGVAAPLLPLVASIAAPTLAMARSYTVSSYGKELATVDEDIIKGYKTYEKNPTAQGDFKTGVIDGTAGIESTLKGNKTAATGDFENAEGMFDDVLEALGFPPLQ